MERRRARDFDRVDESVRRPIFQNDDINVRHGFGKRQVVITIAQVSVFFGGKERSVLRLDGLRRGIART